MVIAGVLAAGLSGGSEDEPRGSGSEIGVDGIGPESDQLELTHDAGKTFEESWYLKAEVDPTDNTINNVKVVWNQMEARIAGEKVTADVLKATVDGTAIVRTEEKEGASDNTYVLENDQWDADINNLSGVTGDNFTTKDNLDFYLGDLLRISNLDPGMSAGDTVAVIWTPDDETLFEETV